MRLINLLSKEKQQDLLYEAITRNITGLWLVLFLVVLIALLSYSLTRYELTKKRDAVNEQVNQIQQVANKAENSAVKSRIKNVNDDIQDYLSLSQATPKWSQVMEAFIKDLPDGVKITALDTDPKKLTMTVSGTSALRDNVIKLYNNINDDNAHFENINYPLETRD